MDEWNGFDCNYDYSFSYSFDYGFDYAYGNRKKTA